MTKILSVFLVLVGPLVYWALGLPWVLTGPPGRTRLAPLVGCGVAGLYAEFAMILGLPVRASVGFLLLTSLAFCVVSRHRIRGLPRLFADEWLPIFLAAVAAASVSPFPVLGNWSGDWLFLYQMGESLMRGGLGSDMLARPPLFGAAATPLWILGEGLIPYQVMAAVASASAVTALLYFIDDFWSKFPRLLLLPLVLSPFFLHNAAAAWGKFLAAGLILAAFVEAMGHRRWASAALFAVAVAVHEGSIIWAPCILLAHAGRSRGWRGTARAVGPMIACGLIVVGPLQAWILLKYGLAAKIAANPAVAGRDSAPFAVKTALVVVTTFVGWGPALSLERWLKNPQARSVAVASKEIYWLLTSWMTLLSGTVVGVIFPFFTVARQRFAPLLRKEFFRPLALAVLAFAVLANGILCGFYSNEGTMQAALVPLALGAYGALAGELAASGVDIVASSRRMAWIMAIVGTTPWFITNALTSIGLWLSAGFRERMRTGSEGDYFRVIDNHLSPLGMVAFPIVPLLCLAGLAAWLVYRRSSAGDRAA